jgi:hypothetical protein
MYIHQINGQGDSRRLADIPGPEIVGIVEDFRARLQIMDRTDDEYESCDEAGKILQAEAEKRGYTFKCWCGAKGMHRHTDKKVYCALHLKEVLRKRAS